MKVSMDIDDSAPLVELTTNEISRRSGPSGGPEVAMVEVLNGNGKKARFWVYVTMEGDRPVVSVATGLGTKRIVRKTKGKCDILPYPPIA